MSDRGEGGHNRIAGADALPVLCRKIEECHELFTILLQSQRSLGVLCFIGFDEQIKGLDSIILGLSLPDVVDRGLGLWLRQFGNAIQHVHRFVPPAALVTGLGANLIHGHPEAHGTVPDGQLWGIHSPEAEKNFAPALTGFAHPVLYGQEAFLATGRHVNNHKGAERVILASKAAVNAVSADIEDRLVIDRSAFTAVLFLGPIPL